MTNSTLHQGYSSVQVPWLAKPINSFGPLSSIYRTVATRLVVLVLALLAFTTVQAQTKYTADFSTSPTFDYEGGQTYYKTKTTVSINGVNYLIHNAINADFTWTGSAVSYNPYSGVGLLIEREDKQLFNFFGVDLNYTSVNTDLAHAPWLTVSYQGANGVAAPSEPYNETSKNFSVSKPAGVAVKYVQLYFADVATLILDNLIVGPAATTPTCFNPTLPTISATRTAICAGSSTILSVQSGSLNDATNWKWYSGSCGGTPAGTGSQIQVSPGSTTTYYVRGEGGCVTPGSCASQQITVSAPFFPSLSNNGPLTCAKTSVRLTTTGGPQEATYTYSVGTQANSASSMTATVTNSGRYSVTVSQPGGCSATATTTVNSNTVAPSVSISPTSQTICQGQSASFIASGADTYQWSSGQTTASISVSLAGPYTVSGTATSNGCSATATATLTVTPLPDAPKVSNATYCLGQSTQPLSATANPGASLRYYASREATDFSTTAPTPPTSTTGVTTFYVSQLSSGCESARAPLTVTVNPLPTAYSLTGGGVYCAGGTGVMVGLSGSQTGVSYQLLRGTTVVGSPVAGTGNPLSFGNQTQAGTYTVLATNTSTSCQQPMSGSATVSITPLPDAPSVVTAGGYPYPAGQSTLTIAQNVGPVSLTVVGCSGGMLMAGGNAASSFTISTAMTGTQTYTATCTSNGCTSPAGSFQLTVVPTTLSVLHRDQDYGSTQNNSIKPYLELVNGGGSAIPYGELTLRYWFTSEGQAPPTNLAVYYAQLGAVNMTYVPLSQPRQGASGYVEYSFPGGGSLAGGGNSGPIENGIQKTDGSNFDESDDYSYQANYQDYIPNSRITAYRNGVIFYGQEPTAVSSVTAVQVYTAAKDGPTTSQIQTRVELRNTGNAALAVQDFRIRYYFTSDNNQPANVYVDYADIGASNIQARVIKLPAPVNGADSYVELRTVPTSLSLSPMSSLGAIDFRLVRSDNGLFDQSNDYSYMANYGNVGLNNHVTVLLNNRLIFGTPPNGAPARVAASEAVAGLSVKVLGNPVVDSHAQVELSGVEGQAVHLRLVDLQGKTVHEQRIEQAGETESVSMPLGQSRGMLLLKVNTDSQQQQVKLLRP